MVKQVTNRHRRIMEDLVLEGMRPCEVAIRYAITESRLSILRRSPLWQAEEAKMREEHLAVHKSTLHTLIPAALSTLKTAVNDEDVRVGLAAAKDILNRNGLLHREVVGGSGTSIRIVLDD